MTTLRQVAAVTLLGLRTIPDRLGASLVIVVGMASVVGVFISILSMSVGYMQIVQKTGHTDRAMVLSQGALFEYASFISRGNALTIADAPGVKRTADGKPVVSPDSLAFVVMPKKRDGLDAYVILRGIGSEGFALRPEVKLTGGRMFNAGAHELIAGKAAQAEFDGLTIGSQVSLPEGDWTVTGTFESNGDARESELMADSVTLGQAMRAGGYKSMTVQLESADAFDRFKEALTTNPQLAVEVVRETEYLANQSRNLNEFLTVVAYVVGGIMALGATFGAMNTMYSAVSARAIEIATLRAIGFGAGAVVASILAEALLLAVAGAAIGIAIAWLAFNGNQHMFGSLVFTLAVTPALVGLGAAFACALGVIGGLFPAIRAARRPVAMALRAT
jgi:putative ABC transport system permease protein